MQAYPWLVFFHLLGAFGFVFAHGSSAFISFRLRRERNVDRIAAMLELTNLSAGLMYASLAILLIAGILAGLAGRWFSQGWIWAALALLIAVTVAMFAIATPYYNRLRGLAGLPGRDRRQVTSARASEAEIATALQSRRPQEWIDQNLGKVRPRLRATAMIPLRVVNGRPTESAKGPRPEPEAT